MAATIGDIIRTEHGIHMTIQGGYIPTEDDRGVLDALRDDLMAFNDLARPYLYAGSSGKALYNSQRRFDLEVLEVSSYVPEGPPSMDVPVAYSKVFREQVMVRIEASVHHVGFVDRKVLALRASYAVGGAEELADMILELANERFQSRGGSA